MAPISFTGNKLNILYSNDWHANVHNIKRYASATSGVLKQNKGKEPVLIVLGGDASMDTGINLIRFVLKAIKKIKVDAVVMGNHDLEGGDFWAKAFAKEKSIFSFLSKKPKPKFLSANLSFSRKNPVENKLAKSAIIKCKSKSGTERVGLVGVSPLDYERLSFIAPYNDYLKVMDLGDTLKSVMQEAQKLKCKGVNKLGCLAHTGKTASDGTPYYIKLAETDEFDFIIGGHDHEEVDLWHTTKSGKNVKIVSLGRTPDKDILGENLDSFGNLRLIYDDNNNLIPEKCENKIELTANYPISKTMERLEKKYMQSNKVISHTNKALTTNFKGTEENPVANLAADAMLWMVNKETKGAKAQIAFVNSGGVRGNIPQGEVTVGVIKQAFPFTASTLIKTTLTKAQIIDTLNWCAESTTLPKISPGLMQVGGMKYTIDSHNKVKDVYLITKKGTLGERIDNQPNDKTYSVIYDNFLMTGVAGLEKLIKNPKDSGIEYFSFNRQDALIEYLKEFFKNKPIEVQTGRIKKEAKETLDEKEFASII